MEVASTEHRQSGRVLGRPYRSHSHPACLPCRKRKSRCQTRNAADKCMLCQAHGTECVFPGTQSKSSRSAAASRSSQRQLARVNRPGLPSTPQLPSHLQSASPRGTGLINAAHNPAEDYLNPSRSEIVPFPSVGILADASNNSSHVVSPAVADDSDMLESYLTTTTTASGRRLIGSFPGADVAARPARPVLFSVVPKRPYSVTSHTSRASEKCELIEKFIEPHARDLVDLFFAKANICFPILDELSFKNTYFNHREKISPALLCNLYASALVYHRDSPQLSLSRSLDIGFIWVQAYEALSSEVFLSPGTSTVISIILNVCGRPTTSMFCNGGMMGLAVAFANALGLNRDPSDWNISPLEKRIRIRLWWLVVVHDRWCSLAYGTPLLIHRSQHDVPVPTTQTLCSTDASPSEAVAASVFISLVTLTEALGHYLEFVYQVAEHSHSGCETSTVDLEMLLGEWEETLSDDVRRAVIWGTNMDAPGAANLRLSYLAVKLLLRRIQLDLDKGQRLPQQPYYLRAERAAEDIVHFVEELEDCHLRGFWIPSNGFALTSATTFLLRSALKSKHSVGNTPLKLARNMIDTLKSHRQNSMWDLADHCLANCGNMLAKMEAAQLHESPTLPNLEEYPDIDASVLDDLLNGLGGTFEL
ncbi:predicted protein [Uncinocarpus reesii 1704]|uniref:Zn(2)-C6 fungal-type domain-containing protein n=1 Tax=Uncinocarpus reesii (strain UAMH 1704) TaxID=336963 RepID=C4JVT3_UNCRE|nr:uncharacterized protein UREG_06675 [Uncinocarpus reesii 1704]EEP81810.1 predicted protein [Uncinocarpus reesii 1704]